MDQQAAPRCPGTPGWLDEIDPRPGPPFLAMGLRALAPGRWLTVDDPAALAANRAVLAAHPEDVVAVTGGPEHDLLAAARELAALVGEAVGAPVAADGDDPASLLVAAARPVAEDLCLLVRRPVGWVLAAGCVCFPSHWRLRDKVGRPMAEVHGPVPHYAEELSARVDRVLDRLAPGRGSWRRNWLVHVDDRLYAPEPAPLPDPPLTAADAGDRLWLRSEYQTLRRLPRSGAIVFTIRTQQAPLRVVAARPDLRARMAEAVRSWSDELVAYKGGEGLRGPLLGWLSDAGAVEAAGPRSA
ncbi:MAG: DUF3445 domain-containing protein [Acidimicrobiia bacterium]